MNRRWRVRLGLALLVTLHLVIFFPGFFAPSDYAAQNRDLPFAPPSRLHFIDSARSFHIRPFVYPLASRGDGSEE